MEKDPETNTSIGDHLDNTQVEELSWKDLGVTVKDRKSKHSLSILSLCSGVVKAGEVLALMGPSGSGKTTLLNVLAHRTTGKSHIDGKVCIDGREATTASIRDLSSFVEQEDSLIGSLTVRETINFAAQLALPASVSKQARTQRVDELLTAFGLQSQARTIVGTPIRKGISGGQKRRLSVASQLIADPRIIFLDEPTSGLDSAASFEVMRYIKRVAVQHRLIVVASIHQPSTSTFTLFDKLLLLSQGKTCYFGAREEARDWFSGIGHQVPGYTNPAEFLLDLVNVDFSHDRTTADVRLAAIHTAWSESTMNAAAKSSPTNAVSNGEQEKASTKHPSTQHRNVLNVSAVLLHRSWIKSYRDVIAYGIRIAMYTGLAIMMGTVWLRLSTDQYDIQPYINAIFFGSAFMSFMAVAYVPSIIEDLYTFKKERANGLYGPLPFTIANFLIGIPYLFLISIIFSVIAYWLSNFRPTASAFWTWVMWLFLDLLAAESLVVLVTSIVPIFVVSLAVTAFANGLWMSVGGFLVPLGTLNVFWKYVFHYIDYQAYVFQGMMVNEFENRTYNCAIAPGSSTSTPKYECMYPSDLQSEGKIRGTAVLEAYRYPTNRVGEWVGILVCIITAYRILGFLALWARKH